jgi:hypothetical protein
MRRIDRLRAMSAEELAEMFEYKACRWCSYYDEPNDKCSINIVTRNLSHCKVGITEGLNQDDNTMPKLEVGDIIYSYYPKIAKADFYVYLGDNIVWCCKDEVFAVFVEGMKKFIKVIYRKGKHSFNKEEIWRAENE